VGIRGEPLWTENDPSGKMGWQSPTGRTIGGFESRKASSELAQKNILIWRPHIQII